MLDSQSKRAAVEAYAEDEHPVLRFLVGLHPASSSEVLDALILDPLPWMKESVAFNPQAPESLLTRLYEESDVAVHRALACNTACPKPLQLQLASHEDRRVRIHLANHCSDEDVWRALIENADLNRSPATWGTIDPTDVDQKVEMSRNPCRLRPISAALESEAF